MGEDMIYGADGKLRPETAEDRRADYRASMMASHIDWRATAAIEARERWVKSQRHDA